jgi:uncharacterized membrane protein
MIPLHSTQHFSAILGGLLLLGGSVALAVNANLKPLSYFAAVVGFYAIIDAYSIFY